MRNYLLGGQTGYLPDHDTLGMDKRTVLSIPENTYLYAKIIHNGKERIHAGQQGLAGRKGKGRGSNAAPEGYLLQGAGIGQERRQASHTTEHRHRALHGMDHQRQEV